MTGSLRGALLAGASVLALVAADGPAKAQGTDAERLHRLEALAHADAISAAWRRLEDHILNRSAAATRWTGSVPPAATGWLAPGPSAASARATARTRCWSTRGRTS